MRTLLITLSLATAATVLAPCAQAQTTPADVIAEYKGTIARINPDDVVVLNVSGRELSITTDAKTVVIIDGQPDKMLRLARGMSATIRTINGTAARIEATSPLRPVD
ncbi:MAG: hypothetical protein ABFD92_14525 [Planctomycetaceae bacterium]|nr:hypothetical protein [Planctomycetaceae bacterium]